jgi:hypothetical protein
MALPKEYTREIPAFALVSQYSVGRINQYPSVRVTFDEVMYLFETDAYVTLALDNDEDGRFETLRVEDWADRLNLVGRTICLPNSRVVGRVLAATRIAPEPDSDGGETPPPYMELVLDLDEEFHGDPTDEQVCIVATMPVGTPAYRRARSGSRWELFLDGADPVAMGRMSAMLGRVYFKAVKAALVALRKQNEVTDLELQQAIGMLAAQGINIDGLLAQEGEQLEMDRRNGIPTGSSVFGDAP